MRRFYLIVILILLFSNSLTADLTIRKSVMHSSTFKGINERFETIYFQGDRVMIRDSSENSGIKRFIYDCRDKSLMAVSDTDKELAYFDKAALDYLLRQEDDEPMDARIESFHLDNATIAEKDSLIDGFETSNMIAEFKTCGRIIGEGFFEMPFACNVFTHNCFGDSLPESDNYGEAISAIKAVASGPYEFPDRFSAELVLPLAADDSVVKRILDYENMVPLTGETWTSLSLGDDEKELCDNPDAPGITLNIQSAYTLLGISTDRIDKSLFEVPEGYTEVENIDTPEYDIDIPGLE